VDPPTGIGGASEVARWYPDPVGRHDFRFWSGDAWTGDVSDQGIQTDDPIESITPEPVTIRPSWAAFWSRTRSVPLWRWILGVALPLIGVPFLYQAGGWLLVELVGGFGLFCLLALPVLYFRLFYIRADTTGIEVRNQFGVRKLIPRERIASIAVGTAFDGALSTADFVFIVSSRGGRLGRFNLQSWNADDFRLLAGALGLHLYGRPNRRLDEFHSAKPVEYAARYFAGSLVVGILFGCGLLLLFVVALAVAIGLARAGLR
jgi:hypothetical protein